MKEKRFRCRCCLRVCTARVPNQKYCGEIECQKARRNAWYREKCACDPDYRANQRASNEAWMSSQGGSAAYFRDYRKRRKAREAESARGWEAKVSLVGVGGNDLKEEIKGLRKSAKLDVSFGETPFKSGRYIMIRDHAESGAKLDVIFVEIAMISGG